MNLLPSSSCLESGLQIPHQCWGRIHQCLSTCLRTSHQDMLQNKVPLTLIPDFPRNPYHLLRKHIIGQDRSTPQLCCTYNIIVLITISSLCGIVSLASFISITLSDHLYNYTQPLMALQPGFTSLILITALLILTVKGSWTGRQIVVNAEHYEVKEVILPGSGYQMTWTSSDITSQFDYFNSLIGEGMYYLVFNHTLQPDSSLVHVNTAIYFLLDPKYIDQKIAVISVPLNKSFDVGSGCWIGTSTAVVELFYDLEMQGKQMEVPNTKFMINETHTSVSSDKFSFTTLSHPQVYQPLLPWVMLLPSLLFLLCMRFVQVADIPPLKISMLTLFINLNFLLFVSLVELYYGVMGISNSQGWLIFTGIVTFCSVVRFVQCFEPVIRRINGVRGYLQFYLLTFVYLWLLFNYPTSTWFVVVNSWTLVPQIMHNAYEGIRPGFYPSFLFTIILSQIYMVYYKGCPSNIMNISPNIQSIVGIVISLLMQVGVLYAQHKLGSRFFIPKVLIPGYFNYFEYLEVDLTTGLREEECMICLVPLGDEPGQTDVKKQDLPEKNMCKKIMKTPCNHRFHVACLEAWMQHKMECPVDRSKLPPLES